MYETVAFDHQTVTVSTGIATLDPTKVAPAGALPAVRGVFTVEGGAVRFWYDGQSPTSTDGHLYDVAEEFEIWGTENLLHWKATRATGTDGKVQVSLERGL